MFDVGARCCPTFPLALVGTVLTLPSSSSWKKQRTGRSETTALNTALPSPWQRAPAHPRRAPHCFASHLTQKNAGSASSRSNFRVQVRSVGSGVNGGAKSNAPHSGIKIHTQLYSTDTFPRRSKRASRSRTAGLLLKLRNLRCCNASKSTLNY